ncbi:hypothetical protein [Alkaliphilus hydrothermalis]|uniref:Lipoprotein n=1 Tax=Alkaliphilus hydrothermalis TaxID=1482730 RepID=A0ABS2NS43_9FIRM|nr:hypothetical protein [Alkaliphilus hydrothermalis]MBM7615785.1 hypothetical protein [Alkaliphilus hydrothermalis]
MNTKKIWYILFLVGMLILSGCTKNIENTDLAIETPEATESKESVKEAAKVSMVKVQEQEENQSGIQLKQEDHLYVLKGISNYFNSLVVPVKEQLKLIENEGQKHLSLNLQGLKWEEKEGNFTLESPIVENIRVGMMKDVPKEELELTSLSPNRNKIAVVNPEENNIKILNFSNNDVTIIESIDIKQIKKPYDQNIIFSSKGGYVSIQMIDEKNGEGFISFGADSGKKVHDLIYGVEAGWSYGEGSIAFVYRDGDKIGIYKRRSDEIDYYDEIVKPESVFGPLRWAKDDSAIYYTTGTEKASNIHIVKMKEKTITRIQEGDFLTETDFTKVSDTYFSNNQLVYALSRDEGNSNVIKTVELKGGGSGIYDGTSSFDIHEGGRVKKVNFYALKEGILYIKDHSVYLMEGSSAKCILKNKGSIQKVQYINEHNLLVFYIEVKDDKQLIFLSLNDLV